MSPGQTGHITGQMGRVPGPGQTGRTPGGVPPKFFMFIGFFLSPKKDSSGVEKLTRSSLKGFLNRALFAYKRWAFCKQFSPLRYRTSISLEKGKLSFKDPSPKPHLNRTGSVFALPKEVWCVYQKACFQGKKKENTYTPKSLRGGCWGPLRAVLVYRFWPPMSNKVKAGFRFGGPDALACLLQDSTHPMGSAQAEPPLNQQTCRFRREV